MTKTGSTVIERKCTTDYIRIKPGSFISCTVAQSEVLQFERHTRRSTGYMNWHFKQPRLAFLRHGPGIGSSELIVNGVAHRAGASDHSTITVVPPNTLVEGVFKVSGNADMFADYSIVFLNNEFVGERRGIHIDRPVVAQPSAAIANRLLELELEVKNRDNLFDLYAEGWACQVLVLTSRLLGESEPVRASARGGMTRFSVRRINDFIEAHLDGELRLDDLAGVAGLSKHHFLRTFRQTTGQTPHQYVMSARIRRAKNKLAMAAGDSMTEIALACGFSNSQNFSTIFRKATGLTPTTFRCQSLA